jgi:hypothetical protein
MNSRLSIMRFLIGSLFSAFLCHADIPEQQFNEMIHTFKTYDLNNADEAGFRYYISLITLVDEQGSEEQKNIIQRVFQEEPDIAPKRTSAIDISIATIQSTLASDVISPAAWKDIVHNIARVEQNGSAQEKNRVQTILIQNTEPINRTIKNIITATLQTIDVQNMLKAVTVGTVYGVLPSVAFKALTILSGNLDLATAGTELVDVGVLSALDALARYTTQSTSELTSASVAGAASMAIQDFLGYAGTRPSDIPLIGPLGKPLLGIIQGAGLTLFKQELNRRGGAQAILTHINWRDMAIGPEEGALVEQSSAFNFIKDNLALMVQNKTVQSAIATTLTHAAEGALMGAAMHILGVGFYEESTIVNAMAQSMVRGALEGLYHFSIYKEQPVGALQRLHGGFVARSMQQFIQSGTGKLGLLSITPVIVQQLSTSAINSIVRTGGGWGSLIRTIFHR